MRGLKKGEHKDIEMPFGRYGPKGLKPGKLICDLPDWYLDWICAQVFVKEDYPEVFKQACIEIKFRRVYDIKKRR